MTTIETKDNIKHADFAELADRLDSSENIRSLDPAGMYDKIYHFPQQLEQAVEIGGRIELPAEFGRNFRSLIVAGMGGSAIGGDLVRSYLSDRLRIPFVVCRNYRLPDFVDENSLVIVSSYSGNTEETLAAFDDATKRGATIACITTGGELGKLAQRHKLLLVKLPEGYQPRAALGFSFVPLLILISKMGLVGSVDDDLKELIRGLKSYRDTYSTETGADKNPAKLLAIKLYNRIPIIYTGPELTDVVGTRWKGQICENAKALAFNNQFPEFNHNELVGWNVIEACRDKLVVLCLRDGDDHDRVQLRMSIVRDIIDKLHVEVINVLSQGDFALGRMFSLIQLGDFTSFYLAVLNKVDPSPVKVIDYLKEELKK
ncbi:MAG: bifunctional phosphoglucose/phosphomannose isomerase [Candidatus Zixiibacteriota bacterium]|nr:MAG: bifunctional phosphoglucose/phosphomannose isomerase [candidate division Zixibacteria bacterium]